MPDESRPTPTEGWTWIADSPRPEERIAERLLESITTVLSWPEPQGERELRSWRDQTLGVLRAALSDHGSEG